MCQNVPAAADGRRHHAAGGHVGADGARAFRRPPEAGGELRRLPPDDGPDRPGVRRLRRDRQVPDDRKRRDHRPVGGDPRLGGRRLDGKFTGVRELATRLAASDQVRDCVATQWFRYAAGRTEEVPDGCSLTTLQDAFGASGGDLGELVVAMTQTDAFWYRAPFRSDGRGPNMNPLRFTRRNLLRGGLAATAASRCWSATRAGARRPPTHALGRVRHAERHANSLFWPTGTETNFTLNTFTPRPRALQEQADLSQGHQAEPGPAERRAGRDGWARSTRAARAAC